MQELIKELGEDIYKLRRSIEEKAKNLRNKNIIIEGMMEERLIKKVNKIENLSLKIAAIDSGVFIKEFHGFYLLIIRSLGVIFRYENSKLIETTSFPKFPKVASFSFSEEEVEAIIKKNIKRVEEELSLAIKCMKENDIDALLIDGSLLPLPSDRPKEDSAVFQEFRRLIEIYNEILKTALDRKVMLIGVVKDSRSKKIIKELGINKGVDSYFLNFFLKKGERTSVFEYSKEDKLLREIKLSEKIRFFYLKASENDFPLRVEFIAEREESIEKTASLIYSLTSPFNNFAYPSILLEVDRRVAIKKEEVNSIEKLLSFYSNNSITPLRRNSRPFR